MGDRANVKVIAYADDPGVYLYTHWDGTELPEVVQEVLSRGLRWNDGAYLTRIVFCAMVRPAMDAETGFGIATFPPDAPDRVIELNCATQTVVAPFFTGTFAEYVAADFTKREW